MKEKWRNRISGIIMGFVIGMLVVWTIRAPISSTVTTQTITLSITITRTATTTFTQNSGLIYIGSITNMSKSENLTCDGIRVMYVAPYGPSIYTLNFTANSPTHILMIIHYRGYLMNVSYTYYEGTPNSPYGSKQWSGSAWVYDFWESDFNANMVVMGVTQLDFYILS
jgi:hypothetical protein